jgi:hypothetical protein
LRSPGGIELMMFLGMGVGYMIPSIESSMLSV